MRVMIWVCTLFIYGALLSGCGAAPANSEFYGMTERARIEAGAANQQAQIAATVEAQRIAADLQMAADTNQTNAQIAQTQARASVQNNQAWSSAVVVMVLLISAGTVVAIVAYWFGRGRVAVVEASARVAIAQLDHNAAIALIDGGPRGNEAFVPMDAYARLYGKDYIIQYDGDPQWYAPTKDKLVRLIEPKQIGHIDY